MNYSTSVGLPLSAEVQRQVHLIPGSVDGGIHQLHQVRHVVHLHVVHRAHHLNEGARLRRRLLRWNR